MTFRYIPYTFLGLMLSVTASAQTPAGEKKNQPEKGTLSEEIEVVRPYKPVLADAAKIRRSPDLSNFETFKPNLTYTIFDKRLELNSDLSQLKAQALSEAPIVPLRNNYAKAGLGTQGTTLGEVYINTGEDEALQAGFFFKHIAQSGDLNKQKVSRQDAGIFGKSIQDKITINGKLGFDRLGTYFYGVNPAEPQLNPDPRKQSFSTVSLQGELIKNYQPETSLDYALKADAYHLSNRYNSKESSFALSGFFNNVWRQFNIGLNSSLDFTTTTDSMEIGNHIFRANPYIKFQGKNYKISLGLNLVQEFGENPGTNVLPVVTAELPIVPQYATIFGGYTGDVLKSSLREFAYDNPYLAKSIIKNAVEKSNIYGGIKGNAGAGFGFKAMIYFKNIDDMPLYAGSKYGFERFELRYDNTKVTGFEGEVNVKASETLTWNGKVEMNNYKTSTEEEAWLKPGFRLYSNARLSINKKFIVDGEVVLNSDSEALAYTSAGEEKILTVKSYVDLSAGAEYMIQNKLGVFLRINNLFGNQYQQFIYYPKLGLNIIGGLNYSF